MPSSAPKFQVRHTGVDFLGRSSQPSCTSHAHWVRSWGVHGCCVTRWGRRVGGGVREGACVAGEGEREREMVQQIQAARCSESASNSQAATDILPPSIQTQTPLSAPNPAIKPPVPPHPTPPQTNNQPPLNSPPAQPSSPTPSPPTPSSQTSPAPSSPSPPAPPPPHIPNPTPRSAGPRTGAPPAPASPRTAGPKGAHAP